ncbi:hypothetical protein OC846_005470 [Tilletia horrida]|uniref:Tautomerase cis-CaaD-like domain-containing protein n=1 Tax=Tilletia horrida TaxID=155126 RepID=A0AAN6GMW9_9BASI|nr:hypothetical protein OC846_005470 [Tilletia horrida]KAK0547226.1 hypothetical protein OC845_004213 [Tilletia horrida]KAK0561656.1 hypothetical protein OC861_005708 [Tilletia horrida]
MPLHRIFHPKSVFTDPAEKKALVDAITDIYSGPNSRAKLPRFYVVIVFHALEPGTEFFIGGESADNFVRFAVDHIAVPLPPKEGLRQGKFDDFMERYEKAIQPFVKDKGLHHEVTIADSPRETWRIDGMVPPKLGTTAIQRWHAENRATPFTEAENQSDSPF